MLLDVFFCAEVGSCVRWRLRSAQWRHTKTTGLNTYRVFQYVLALGECYCFRRRYIGLLGDRNHLMGAGLSLLTHALDGAEVVQMYDVLAYLPEHYGSLAFSECVIESESEIVCSVGQESHFDSCVSF